MHRHADAYAAIVLSGGYEEVGSNGRFHVGPGDVLLHDCFDAHFNRFERTGARLFNLPLRRPIGGPLARVDDPDQLLRIIEADAEYAWPALERLMRPVTPKLRDWPDILAQDLITDPAIRLERWARDHGLAPATISRGFRKAFGVSAVAFRAEARARRALRQISNSKTSLALVAAEACFADQAHMSRAIKAMTGQSPASWKIK